MKFWAWLALKLAGVLVLMVGFWAVVAWALPPVLPPPHHSWMSDWPMLSWIMVVVSTAAGFFLGWLAAADQLYRCRVCARRLRLPLSAGDFSRAVLHVPETEYICAYGHGKLTTPEVHMSSSPQRRWVRYGDLWQSLIAADRGARHL